MKINFMVCKPTIIKRELQLIVPALVHFGISLNIFQSQLYLSPEELFDKFDPKLVD